MRHFRVFPLTAAMFVACTNSTGAPLQPIFEMDPAEASAAKRVKHARADLIDTQGQVIGNARFTEDSTGQLHLSVHVQGISEGLHGIHLHAVGACVVGGDPAFVSAGPHFNPHGKQHGLENPDGHHAGDLPNLIANKAGVGRLSTTIHHVTLADLLDDSGSAVVLHQSRDDQLTDPSGNSGARIACGVIAPK